VHSCKSALSFSPSELVTLIFSRDLLKPLEGTEMQLSLEAAFNKAADILPPEGMAHVRQMQRYFSVGLGLHKNYREHRKTIEQLRMLIWGGFIQAHILSLAGVRIDL
jgi:hypothetical protein